MTASRRCVWTRDRKPYSYYLCCKNSNILLPIITMCMTREYTN